MPHTGEDVKPQECLHCSTAVPTFFRGGRSEVRRLNSRELHLFSASYLLLWPGWGRPKGQNRRWSSGELPSLWGSQEPTAQGIPAVAGIEIGMSTLEIWYYL